MAASKKLEKEIKEDRIQQLIELTASFCIESLDEDYRELCEKLIKKMARKRKVPFLSGRIEIWAAAVVYALGSMNFLFDRNSEPYATADDICQFFGTSKSTTSQKAKSIKDMFKMNYFDDEFSTTYVKERNPFSNMVMINGFIMDLEDIPHFQTDLPVKNEEIYLIKVTLDFWLDQSTNTIHRIFAIKGEDNLYNLAKTIIKSFNFDFDHSFGFYDNINDWTGSMERYELLSDMYVNEDSGSRIKSVRKVNLQEIFKDNPSKKMLFLYDYGDEWHFIVELLGIDIPVPNQKYPLLIESIGKAPSQYGNNEKGDVLHPSQTSLDIFQ
jgi:hypothetical protein